MTDEMKLLPCPFCGGESHIGTVRYNSAAVRNLELEQDTFFKVNCVKCGANNLGVGGYATEADAAEAWNARATPSSLGDGWVMVPREPTDEMLLKGHHQIDWGRDDQPTNTNDDPLQKPGGVGTTCKEDLRDAYRAMLSSAPSPGGDHGA